MGESHKMKKLPVIQNKNKYITITKENVLLLLFNPFPFYKK